MGASPDWLEAALEPRADDSSDLRWALETAVALFLRGDRPQALRWLQHAALTAKTEGQPERAHDLDRAARELEQRPFPQKRSNPGIPATQAMPAISNAASVESTLPDNSPPESPSPPPEAAHTTPYKIAPDELTRLGAPDSQLLAACEASEATPNLANGEAPFTPPPPARPRPPTLMRDGLDATLTNVRRERPAPPSINRDQGEHTMVMGPDEVPQPSVAPRSMTRTPSTLGSPQIALEPMRAVRVVIEPASGRNIALRLLDEGEEAPFGAQEALLIPLGIGKKPPLDPNRS